MPDEPEEPEETGANEQPQGTDGSSLWGPPSGARQDPPPGVEPDGSGSALAVPFPDAPESRRGRRLVLAAVGVVVVLGIVATVLVITLGGGDDTTTVATADGEVADAEVVLDEATTEFMLAVRSSGARVHSATGCFWRLGTGDDEVAEAIVCGPVRFAAGGDWLEVPIESEPAEDDDTATVSYAMEASRFVTADDAGVTSEEIELVGIEDAEPRVADLEDPERSGHAFLPDGRRLESADELVAAGLEVVSEQTGEVAPRVHERASCWLPGDDVEASEPSGGGGDDGEQSSDDDPDDRDNTDGTDASGDERAALLCGPVLELRDDPSMPWKLLEADIETSGGPWAVTADPASLEVAGALALPDDIDLYHPEGQEPPPAPQFRPPDPLPVGDNYAAVAFESQLDGHEHLGDLEFENVQRSTVRTPDFTANLGGRATTRRLGEGPDALIAPDDHQFAVVKYTARPAPGDGQANPNATRLEMVAGQARRPLNVGELPAVGGPPRQALGPRMQVANTRGATLVVVTVVPQDTPDAELLIGNRGRAQRVSIRSGSGTSIVDGVDRHGDVLDVGTQLDVGIESPGANNSPQPPEGEGFLRGNVARAHVLAWNGYRNWAPEGTVFVVMEIRGLTDSLGGPEWNLAYRWRQSFSLRTPDDQVLEPLGVADQPLPIGERPRPLRFAVPADVDNVALIVEPFGIATHPGEDVEFPIEFDQSFETSFSLR